MLNKELPIEYVSCSEIKAGCDKSFNHVTDVVSRSRVNINPKLSTRQKEMVLKLLGRYPEVLSEHDNDVGFTQLIEHDIVTTDDNTIDGSRQCSYKRCKIFCKIG